MANTNTIAAARATSNFYAFSAGVRTMSSREIAELTGKEHKNVLADIRSMLDDLGLTSAEFSADLPDSYGRMQPGFRLPKRETLILVSGYNIAMRARIIDRWQELEEAQASAASPGLADKIQCLGLIADGLRLEGSARLGVYQRGLASLAPELLPAVPVYAIDAPSGSEALSGGSEPTASLSDLLKQHGVGKSALAVNKLLASAGLIEQMTRPSSRGADAKFWSVTERGQRWGKNVTSPSNPKETQPHWYVSQFAALMTEIGLRSIATTIGGVQ